MKTVQTFEWAGSRSSSRNWLTGGGFAASSSQNSLTRVWLLVFPVAVEGGTCGSLSTATTTSLPLDSEKNKQPQLLVNEFWEELTAKPPPVNQFQEELAIGSYNALLQLFISLELPAKNPPI